MLHVQAHQQLSLSATHSVLWLKKHHCSFASSFPETGRLPRGKPSSFVYLVRKKAVSSDAKSKDFGTFSGSDVTAVFGEDYGDQIFPSLCGVFLQIAHHNPNRSRSFMAESTAAGYAVAACGTPRRDEASWRIALVCSWLASGLLLLADVESDRVRQPGQLSQGSGLRQSTNQRGLAGPWPRPPSGKCLPNHEGGLQSCTGCPGRRMEGQAS